MAHDSDPQSNVPQQTTTENRDTITIILPFKDQKLAKVVKYQLFDLSKKVGKRLNPVFSSRIGTESARKEAGSALQTMRCVYV